MKLTSMEKADIEQAVMDCADGLFANLCDDTNEEKMVLVWREMARIAQSLAADYAKGGTDS